MRKLHSVRLKFSAAYTFWTAALAPLGVALFLGTLHQELELYLLAAIVAGSAVFALVTFRGRRVAGWAAAAARWVVRRRWRPDAPTEAAIGATVQPGDPVAVRWEGRSLVAVIKLIPQPFTPTVVVDGRARTDDVLDTKLLEHVLSASCPDLEADVVSAGYRVSRSAAPDVVDLYARLIDRDPAPAHRRTWIMLRADPQAAQRSAQRRDADIAGLARYLVASTTRVADQLAEKGIDAVCEFSFRDYDEATEISFKSEKWSTIEGQSSYTTAYAAPGGPDAWWSVPADRTITRVRVAAGLAPRTTVFLTTTAKPSRPRGFSPVSGGQRDALGGRVLTADSHHRLPIGSAGVLVGETANLHRLYLPFDDVDAGITLGDARMFTQFAVRAVAAGGIVTLHPEFQEFASLIGGQVGPEVKVEWPRSTTYISPRPGIDSVVLRRDVLRTPRNRQVPIGPITPPEEGRYQQALPGAGRSASRGTRPRQDAGG